MASRLLPEDFHPGLLGGLAHRRIESGEGQSFPRSKIDGPLPMGIALCRLEADILALTN
jgi:hypothetical protein